MQVEVKVFSYGVLKAILVKECEERERASA